MKAPGLLKGPIPPRPSVRPRPCPCMGGWRVRGRTTGPALPAGWGPRCKFRDGVNALSARLESLPRPPLAPATTPHQSVPYPVVPRAMTDAKEPGPPQCCSPLSMKSDPCAPVTMLRRRPKEPAVHCYSLCIQTPPHLNCTGQQEHDCPPQKP